MATSANIPGTETIKILLQPMVEIGERSKGKKENITVKTETIAAKPKINFFLLSGILIF